MIDAPRCRRALDAVLMLAALVGGGFAAAELRQPWTRGPAGNTVWILLVAAGLLGGFALRRMSAWLEDDQPRPRPAEFAASKNVGLALVFLGLATLVTVWLMHRLWPDYHAWHGTFLPWVVALALTTAAGFLLGSSAPPGDGANAGAGSPEASLMRQATETAPRHAGLPRRAELVLFLVIAALALFVRVYRIGEIPAGIYVDETNGGLDALQILEGNGETPFGTGWYGTPTGYEYYMAGVFKLLGATWAGLKAASIIPAFLTVLAMYPLGRLLFGRLGGLGAMAFLAFSRWHMTMSRWGWNEVTPPLFQVVATFLLLRGLRDRRSSDFVLGGLVSGLMMYTYLSSRLALATLGIFAIYYLVVAPGGPIETWRRQWRGLVLFLLAWMIAVAPIAVTHITEPFTFFNRVNEISIFKDIREAGSYEPLKLNIEDHLKFFNQIGDHQSKHNLPDEPEADPLVGLLLVIALGYALLSLRDHRRGLLVLWLLFGMAGGVFSSHHESPQSYRTLTAAPAVALFAGDALARASSGVAGGVAALLGGAAAALRRRRWLAVQVVLVLLGWFFSAAWETTVYFGRQAESPAYRAGFNPIENGIARDVIAALKAGDTVFVSPRFYDFSPLRFLVYGVYKAATGKSTLDHPPYGEVALEQDLPVPDTGRDTLLLLDIQYLPLMDYLRLFYPSARIDVALGPDGARLYIRAHLSRADLAATTGLRARLFKAGGEVQELVARAPQDTDLARGTLRAEWDGSIRLDHGGRYDFPIPSGTRLSLDDQAWKGPRFLGRGLHALHLVEQVTGATRAAPLEWVTPGGNREVVPHDILFRLRQPNEGLTTYYYPNRDWKGPPLFERVTPILFLAWTDPDPMPGEFSARFVGSLRVTTPGVYGFQIDADDGATLVIDGKPVGECVINKFTTFPAAVHLSVGDHPIEIRYFQLGGGNALDVFWRPPGGELGLIPPQCLVPLPSASVP
ncbi:MAG: hypothetical protein B7Z68_02900 [Acidobacteria bacterium 21-70-11]|nr:MAG: hypothetical protein B7Z68_02900 [Acidobacteria bacterium 21-70-11]HQT93254.1 PA14 domain-containing protein [Thermoanaerobaculaceae bacterium]